MFAKSKLVNNWLFSFTLQIVIAVFGLGDSVFVYLRRIDEFVVVLTQRILSRRRRRIHRHSIFQLVVLTIPMGCA